MKSNIWLLNISDSSSCLTMHYRRSEIVDSAIEAIGLAMEAVATTTEATDECEEAIGRSKEATGRWIEAIDISNEAAGLRDEASEDGEEAIGRREESFERRLVGQDSRPVPLLGPRVRTGEDSCPTAAAPSSSVGRELNSLPAWKGGWLGIIDL
ncbi:MAG: hypothetical protein HY033_07350 [Ignavibacteriae bacterium]|nr:hypothetical protein [Ignavibacteria bacterium]MBI3364708.1 hypothetical protein [Ignavibacteriota bacterium]